MPEPEPKFNPFTGSGRRLDGRPLSYEPPSSSSSSKDKQPAVANGNGQSSVASGSERAARQAQGKLVFGANANRAPKEAPKVLIQTFLVNAIELRDRLLIDKFVFRLELERRQRKRKKRRKKSPSSKLSLGRSIH